VNQRDVTIGVDIGGTNIRAARVHPDGRMTGLVRVRTDSATSVPELVRELVSRLLDDTVVGVGVGIPGRLDASGTTVLSSGYVRLAGLRLRDILAAQLQRPVVLDNDAAMALVAELRVGAAVEAHDAALFTVGTGVGGALALDRAVVRGRGNAGQLGHLTIDPSGPVCNCGRRGCTEVLGSGTALSGLMREAGLPAGTTAEELLGHGARSAVAVAVLTRWAHAWRCAIDTVVAAFDPDLVLLGGGLGAAAATAVEAYAPATSPWFERPVLAAGLGDDAGVIGAGLRAYPS
jgi:glucokinase